MEQFKHHGYIYITWNQLENKCYVGQKECSPNNSKSYLGSGIILNLKIQKYGKKFFKKIILGEIFSNDIEDFKNQLDKYEEECVYFFRAYGSDGENWDSIYGYNLTLGGKGVKKLSPEKNKARIIKVNETKAANPEINIKAAIKRKITLQNDPNIVRDQQKKRKDTLDSNPDIVIAAQEKRKITNSLKPDSEIQLWKDAISFTKQNKSEEEKKAILAKMFKTLEDDPTILIKLGIKVSEFRKNNPDIEIQRVERYKINIKNNPEREIQRGKNISKTRRINGKSKGKGNSSYKLFDSDILIDLYFLNIPKKEMAKLHNLQSVHSISIGVVGRFICVCGFPKGSSPKHKEQVKKEIFIEENKHKIQWYKDNYERLEEEYWIKK